MSNATVYELSPLLEAFHVIVYPQITLLISYLIYGAYVLLFALCVYTLRRGPVFYHQTPYMTCTILLFVLSSIMIVVVTIQILYQSLIEFNTAKSQDYQKLDKHVIRDNLITIVIVLGCFIQIAANVLADSVLIHRCHIVWNNKRMTFCLATVCLLINVTLLVGMIITALGFSDRESERNRNLASRGLTLGDNGIIASGIFNMVLTCLTAGRIWWISKRTANSSETTKTFSKDYRPVLRIIVESGMLYPLTMVVYVVIMFCLSKDQTPFYAFPLLVLAAGIAPTLIIVRARLGMTSTPTVENIPWYSQMSFRVPDPGCSTIHSDTQTDEP
ncbi:hypothetical protein PM082_013688 [Marasmius tenuissimus]|nr:hypothetical protein PM082_013688 [Marasmius tenuissimus]